jgi:hypothetical protein
LLTVFPGRIDAITRRRWPRPITHSTTPFSWSMPDHNAQALREAGERGLRFGAREMMCEPIVERQNSRHFSAASACDTVSYQLSP